MGRAEEARVLARKTVAAWSAELTRGVDAVAVNASGCGTTVKDYGHLLGGDDAIRIAALARDITEILAALDLRIAPDFKPYRVAYHDACSLQHGQRVTAEPRALLAKAGFEVIDLPERHLCCGSAGTFNLLQPDIAEALGQRKAAHAESTDPDMIAAGNLGCMVQVGRYTRLPVLHTVSLIDWATGGPMPLGLRGRTLRAPQPRPQEPESVPNAAAPAPSNGVGFW
jgi:glycolate oxidase iron-sulfur subunit